MIELLARWRNDLTEILQLLRSGSHRAQVLLRLLALGHNIANYAAHEMAALVGKDRTS